MLRQHVTTLALDAGIDTAKGREYLELALKLQRERLTELQVRKQIREDVQSGADKQQREYFLRKQMESIRKELGEDDASIADEYRTKIEESGMPEAVREQAERELNRLERMGEGGGEGNMVRTYLDWLVAVPWSKRSDDQLDPNGTREVLDADHAGLEDVKDRIVEYVAVKKLRGGGDDSRQRGAVLLFRETRGERCGEVELAFAGLAGRGERGFQHWDGIRRSRRNGGAARPFVIELRQHGEKRGGA